MTSVTLRDSGNASKIMQVRGEVGSVRCRDAIKLIRRPVPGDLRIANEDGFMTLANSLTSSNRALSTTANSRTTSELSTYIVAMSATSNAISAQASNSATSIKG
jgi:hypothetical protein